MWHNNTTRDAVQKLLIRNVARKQIPARIENYKIEISIFTAAGATNAFTSRETFVSQGMMEEDLLNDH